MLLWWLKLQKHALLDDLLPLHQNYQTKKYQEIKKLMARENRTCYQCE